MTSTGHDIVVIGTSAGGLEALTAVVNPLPFDLPAAIFVVQHMAPYGDAEALLRSLRKKTALTCKLAEDGERFRHGRLYLAPPDCHLLVKERRLLVTKGARENRYRPAVDTLFRSAAVAYGPRVIGVILTGLLDDGTVGLQAIKKCGGLAVVQNPKDAAYPEMPQNALDMVAVDHCVPLADMAHLVETLVQAPPGNRATVPKDIQAEAVIAERVVSDVGKVDGLGKQVPYNCPNCGGGLWKMDHPNVQRYRCHTGHSFTASSLLASQSEKIEETLWTSLRMFEERKNLLHSMGRKEAGLGRRSFIERAEETDVHIQRIRAMLLAPQAEASHERAQPATGKGTNGAGSSRRSGLRLKKNHKS